jgi:hypothetical protein
MFEEPGCIGRSGREPGESTGRTRSASTRAENPYAGEVDTGTQLQKFIELLLMVRARIGLPA